MKLEKKKGYGTNFNLNSGRLCKQQNVPLSSPCFNLNSFCIPSSHGAVKLYYQLGGICF